MSCIMPTIVGSGCVFKKNTAQLNTLFALVYLAILKQALLAEPGG